MISKSHLGLMTPDYTYSLCGLKVRTEQFIDIDNPDDIPCLWTYHWIHAGFEQCKVCIRARENLRNPERRVCKHSQHGHERHEENTGHDYDSERTGVAH